MTRSDRDLESLFAGMRAEDASPLSSAEEAEREERMAAHIDHVVARVSAAPRRVGWRSRRAAILLVAASLPLVTYAALRAGRSDTVAWIGRDPAIAPAASSAIAPPHDEREVPVAIEPPPRETKPRLPAAAARSTPSAPNPSSAPPSSADTSAASLAEAPPGAPLTGASSTLSEENRLFQEAARAERSGDNEAALVALDRLAHDFPRSPLAQNAMVRKFHLLARAGRAAEAAAAARDYLRLFPQGFAKREAEEIARE